MTEAPRTTAPAVRASRNRGPLAAWLTPRRAIAWLVAAPLIGASAWAAVRPDDPGTAVAVALIALLGAATLADYVPAEGRRLDVGCEPCAVAAGLSVPAAVLITAAVAPLLGVLVAVAGLVQRLRQPDTCPT